MNLQDFNAKLSDFGLAKDGPMGDQTHVSTRVMGTYGYAAPEYVMTGETHFSIYKSSLVSFCWNFLISFFLLGHAIDLVSLCTMISLNQHGERNETSVRRGRNSLAL